MFSIHNKEFTDVVNLSIRRDYINLPVSASICRASSIIQVNFLRVTLANQTRFFG